MRISIDGCTVSFPEADQFDDEAHPGAYAKAFTVAEATVASLLQMRLARLTPPGPHIEPPSSVKRLSLLGAHCIDLVTNEKNYTDLGRLVAGAVDEFKEERFGA